MNNKSSAAVEMGDRGHNRHGPKRARTLQTGQTDRQTGQTDKGPVAKGKPFLQTVAQKSTSCHY